MPFTHGAKAHDEAGPALWCSRLIGVPHDARIEQSGCLERVLVKKISSHQAALRLAQHGMRLERLLHLRGAGLEDFEQIAVTAFEVLEHLGQLSRGGLRLEPKHPADDMIGPSLVGWIEVPGFSCRLERPY